MPENSKRNSPDLQKVTEDTTTSIRRLRELVADYKKQIHSGRSERNKSKQPNAQNPT